MGLVSLPAENRSHNTSVEPGTLLWSAPDMTSELTHYNIYLAEAGGFEMLFVWVWHSSLLPQCHLPLKYGPNKVEWMDNGG